jgi:ureidoglycolate lyase
MMVVAQPINEEVFAPFGQLIHRPKQAGSSSDLVDELTNLRSHAQPKLSVAMVASAEMPLAATQMERHIHSSQAFIPINCDRYLIIVAPHTQAGQPDASAMRAFIVPGDVGINYKADTWHHPIKALGREASFAVLTFVEGDKAKDEQFVPLKETVTIALA